MRTKTLATLTYVRLEGVEDVLALHTCWFTSRMVAGLMVSHKGPFGSSSALTALNHRCIEGAIAKTRETREISSI